MGRFPVRLLPLLASIPFAAAQHEQYEPAQVQSEVAAMQSQFAHYTGYHGPTGTHPAGPSRTHHPQPTNTCGYWLDEIKHQGVAAFNPNATFQVYRNVKDFGAKGDGVTDDTAAINAAIAFDGTAGPQTHLTPTNAANLVYFPPGTYLISSSIIDYYYTQLIGNPNCMPTLLATANFTGFGLIDGDQYGANGLGFGQTVVFYRQVRNFILDMTQIPATSAATGIHWPTSQATSLQNLVFLMPDVPGTVHQGVFGEGGSGGFMTDLVFYGGLYGLNHGNQQFTMRNMSFYNTNTAINQFWDWGWTYQGLTISNCSTGLNMTGGGPTAQAVGAVILLDSLIENTAVGVATSHSLTSQPPSAGSLILENVQLANVPIAVEGAGGAILLAGTTGATTVAAYAQGHAYTPTGPQNIEQQITPNPRPGVLLSGNANRYYVRSKPQYQNYNVNQFVSARSSGATGNGVTDDTAALQQAVHVAASSRRVLFVDAGTYRVTGTIYIPAGSKIVGEAYSVIMGSGAFFNNINAPEPVVRVGNAGEYGQVEWSDTIMATQGPSAGAILIEWNLASPSNYPSGMWDVHARIGGFIGSNLEGNICPITPTVATPPAPINTACYGAYLTMHVTKSATGLYLENVWYWTADHDLDANYGGNQITIYTGRGMLVESTKGVMWLYGTAVEHHALYQYQFANTADIVMGQIQIEIAYYEPNPNATVPFPHNAALNDPVFPTTQFYNASGYSIPNANGLGLRVLNSDPILVYGAGLYSFFDNWSVTCSNVGNDEVCQSRIFSSENSNVYLYDLHTVGTHEIITLNGADIAYYGDNVAGFTEEVAVFRSRAGL